jgi:predicted transcriptional regulator
LDAVKYNLTSKKIKKQMNKIRLYIDEDSMDEDFVQALRSRNVDVLTVADAGMGQVEFLSNWVY